MSRGSCDAVTCMHAPLCPASWHFLLHSKEPLVQIAQTMMMLVINYWVKLMYHPTWPL